MMATDDSSFDPATAYDGLEQASSFPDSESLVRYRNELLDRTGPQADFLLRRLPNDAAVLEVACGNGRLLIELARRAAIDHALGIDAASSRIEFARKWTSDGGYNHLDFVVGDALTYPLDAGGFDAALCITGALGYFERVVAASLALRLHTALRPTGLLCVEVYPHTGYRRLLEATGGEAHIWTELPVSDPWRFYLSHLALDSTGEVLIHEKTFIHRTSGEVDSGRCERLHLYDEADTTNVLASAGFHEIQLFEGWSDEPYQGGEVMVLTARR
jgi:SAM-dependent methyltransferase